MQRRIKVFLWLKVKETGAFVPFSAGVLFFVISMLAFGAWTHDAVGPGVFLVVALGIISIPFGFMISGWLRSNWEEAGRIVEEGEE